MSLMDMLLIKINNCPNIYAVKAKPPTISVTMKKMCPIEESLIFKSHYCISESDIPAINDRLLTIIFVPFSFDILIKSLTVAQNMFNIAYTSGLTSSIIVKEEETYKVQVKSTVKSLMLKIDMGHFIATTNKRKSCINVINSRMRENLVEITNFTEAMWAHLYSQRSLCVTRNNYLYSKGLLLPGENPCFDTPTAEDEAVTEELNDYNHKNNHSVKFYNKRKRVL